MPQLPSGRHIALDPAPLDKLIRQAEKGALVHQLMAIKSAEVAFSHSYLPRGGNSAFTPFRKRTTPTTCARPAKVFSRLSRCRAPPPPPTPSCPTTA